MDRQPYSPKTHANPAVARWEARSIVTSARQHQQGDYISRRRC